jgi:hypothetical protein
LLTFFFFENVNYIFGSKKSCSRREHENGKTKIQMGCIHCKPNPLKKKKWEKNNNIEDSEEVSFPTSFMSMIFASCLLSLRSNSLKSNG